MWGLFVFVPLIGIDLSSWLFVHLGHQHLIGQFFNRPSSGICILTASIILAIMIIPFVTITFKDAFDLVPRSLKESGYALGCTPWEIIWHIVIPYARIQLIGGTMLGLTRILGETMAVAFVVGNAYNVTTSVLHPGTTIASSLANEFTEAESTLYASSLINIGLILFFITFIVSGIARLILMRLNKKGRA
jgi:phosphate transport system permease protein